MDFCGFGSTQLPHKEQANIFELPRGVRSVVRAGNIVELKGVNGFAYLNQELHCL